MTRSGQRIKTQFLQYVFTTRHWGRFHYGFSRNLAVEVVLRGQNEFLPTQHRLVAAIEIVSPANKDRPEHRNVFVAKCVALLQKGVAVSIVDLVTVRQFNLYFELLAMIGHTDPTMADPPAHLYAASCRWTRQGKRTLL